MFSVGIRDNYNALLKMLCSCIPRLVCIVHKGRYSLFLFVLNHERCSRLLLLVVYSRCYVMSCLPGLVGCNYIFLSVSNSERHKFTTYFVGFSYLNLASYCVGIEWLVFFMCCHLL